MEISAKAKELNLKVPNDQKPNKTPKRFTQNSEHDSPPSLSVKDKFKIIHYEKLDVTISSLTG